MCKFSDSMENLNKIKHVKEIIKLKIWQLKIKVHKIFLVKIIKTYKYIKYHIFINKLYIMLMLSIITNINCI